jgi:hypothetical protein
MTDALVFEEPPKKSRRSEHHAYLLALQDHPGRWARFRAGEVLSEKVASGIANQLRTAASNVGQGYDVTARRLAPNQIPETVVDGTEVYGVWVRYAPSPADQPPEDIAAKMNAEAMAVEPQMPTVPTAADVLQRGVVDEAMPWDGLPEMPVGGAVPILNSAQAQAAAENALENGPGGTTVYGSEYTGKRTTAYGDPAF